MQLKPNRMITLVLPVFLRTVYGGLDAKST